MKPAMLGLLLMSCMISAANAETYKCSFSKHSDPTGMIEDKAPFEMSFLVDHETNKSYIIGNAGSSPVTSLLQKDGTGITFVEVTQSGSVQVTAISPNLAVHSRHSFIGIPGQGSLMPSQYYGTCTFQP